MADNSSAGTSVALPVLDPGLVPVSPAKATAEELLDSFMRSRSERTNRAYRQDLEGFQTWLLSQGVAVETMDDTARFLLAGGQGGANGLALKYQTFLREQGLAPSSINRKMSALKSLVRQANLLGMVPWTLIVTRLKAKAYRDTRGPGIDNYRKMLELTRSRKDPKGIRDYAILSTLYSLALRRSELVNTSLEDLDLQAGALSIIGKGDTQRTKLTLPEPTKRALVAWLEVRGNGLGPLFCGIDKGGNLKGGLTGNGLYHIIKDLGKRVGITTRVHGIRHLACTQAVRAASAADLDISTVLQFSRHSSLKTLEIYIDNDRDYQGRISALVAMGMEG